MGASLKLADVSPDEIVERISNGEIASRIAAELGVTKAAVYYHLIDRPDYPKARKTGMAVRLDDAESEIIDSQDQLSLARGRERFRAVAWRAEREFPELWGNKPGIAININQLGDIENHFGSAAGELLNRLRSVAETPKSTAASPDLPLVGESSTPTD